MLDVNEIHPLTDFLRETKKHTTRLRKTKRPAVLTVNGRAALVVQDAAAYQKLMEALDYAECVQGIQRGLVSVARGESIPIEEAFAQIRKKLKLSK